MLILAEVAPLQVRRTVFIPPTLRPAALSVIGAGVGARAGYSRILIPTAVDLVVIQSRPDHHVGAGPDCRWRCLIGEGSWSGRVGGGGGCPAVCPGIVPPAGVQKAGVATSAPDDHFHFAVAPYSRVQVSAVWCVGGSGGYPAIGVGVVSSASV